MSIIKQMERAINPTNHTAENENSYQRKSEDGIEECESDTDNSDDEWRIHETEIDNSGDEWLVVKKGNEDGNTCDDGQSSIVSPEQMQTSSVSSTAQSQDNKKTIKFYPLVPHYCFNCEKSIGDFMFVQCPSVRLHKFCFQCFGENITSHQAIIQDIHCLSGEKCSDGKSSMPRTFHHREIDRIFPGMSKELDKKKESVLTRPVPQSDVISNEEDNVGNQKTPELDAKKKKTEEKSINAQPSMTITKDTKLDVRKKQKPKNSSEAYDRTDNQNSLQMNILRYAFLVLLLATGSILLMFGSGFFSLWGGMILCIAGVFVLPKNPACVGDLLRQEDEATGNGESQATKERNLSDEIFKNVSFL